jgi:hypothetical protein
MACSLQPDPPVPSAFKGKTGDAVSVSLRGTAGTARIISATYNGAAIPVNPATFTIVAGKQSLDMVVDNDTSADLTKLVCDDDGVVLHQFLYNPGSPVKTYTVDGGT